MNEDPQEHKAVALACTPINNETACIVIEQYSMDTNGFKPRVPVMKRLWNKVLKTDTCWLWQGGTAADGHGTIGVWGDKGKIRGTYVHRLSFFYENQNADGRLRVLHKCDVPNCVNPAHLFAGTLSDNSKDMCAKGRGREQQKTHCVNGHPLSGDNLVMRIAAVCRLCKACERERDIRGRAKKKAKKLLQKALIS